MANIQEKRLLKLKTVLSDDVLLPYELTGFEALSEAFNCRIKMFSDNLNITPDQLFHTSMSITLNKNDQKVRYFNGIVSHLEVGGIYDGVRFYEAILIPWAELLEYTSDCRIFQNLSVVEIAQELFDEYKLGEYAIQLQKAYPKREYCVQYRETAFGFLKRLFQEEGINYYFEHNEDKHKLILVDDLKASVCEKDVIFNKGLEREDHLNAWVRRHAIYPGKHEQTDFNYNEPNTRYHTKNDANPKLKQNAAFCIYDYPGNYQDLAKGAEYANQHFESYELQHTIIEGGGNYLAFAPGSIFELKENEDKYDEKRFLLTQVKHYAKDLSYFNKTSQQSEEYQNSFSSIPADVIFRLPQKYQKPIIHGPQTAFVVSEAGEEICVDQNGAVKVQFHWDRRGKYDQKSSCFIRVAQGLAGNKWGMQFIPRVGQEVIVHFLNGDPDRPIIIGCLYNGEFQPPYDLPAMKTISGIKSHSTKQGGSLANEFYFDDRKDSEVIYLHAQKDLNRVIQNNETTSVEEGNHIITIKSGASTLEAAKSIELKVGGNTLLIDTNGIYLNGTEIKLNN